MQCTNRKQYLDLQLTHQKKTTQNFTKKKKKSDNSYSRTMPGFTNMDPKHYLPFQPLRLSHDTISCADSQGSPLKLKTRRSLHNYLYSSPCRNKWLNPYNSCCGCHFNSMLLSQQTDHLFIADNL